MAKNFKIETLDLLDTSGDIVATNVPAADYYSSAFDSTVLDNCIIGIKHNDDDAAVTTTDVRLEGSFDNVTWIDLETALSIADVTVAAATPDGLLRISDNPFPYLRVYFKAVTNGGDSYTITASGKEL